VSSEQENGSGRIVVGVDPSDASKAALAWALRQAAVTGDSVDAVTAWQVPVVYGYVYSMTPEMSELDQNVRKGLEEAVAEAAKLAPEVKVRALVAQDHPADALLNVAKGASLLVVGSRGHAGFTGALLGSVGQHCVHHAECPVVVVRDKN
jgi:nucleotide-binding universal stress UspA family protein